MNTEKKPLENINTTEQIRKRNRKAVLLTVVILSIFITGIVFARYFFLNRGVTFGSVNGVSTSQSENTLTKINFIDSGSVKSSGVFGTSINSPFTSDFTDKFWIKFNSADKTIIGYIDSDLKFNKVYELPGSIKLVKLLSDSSILFTDEPLKEQPSLYYKQISGDIVKFSSLDFQDTYLSIYFEPSEKLIYYLGKDNANTFFLYSVNEKGKESNLFKTGDLTTHTKIIFIDQGSAFFKDDQICYQLSFSSRKIVQSTCENIKTNDLNLNYSVTPKIQPSYSSISSGELLQISSLDGSKKSLLTLQPNQVISKFSYSGNKLVFAKAALNPIADSVFVSKDVGIEVLNLDNNQVTELTSKLPPDVINNYYSFINKFLAVGGTQNSKVLFSLPEGMSGQVYIGDVSPVSFATVTKYWVEIDLGSSVTNINVLNGDFTL